MIRIEGGPVPAILTSSRMRRYREELFAYLRRPTSERNQRRAPIPEELFYEGELHEAVADRGRRKCAFCECRDSSFRTDHFRPLSARDFDSEADRDHYAWLAYEWENLIYVCNYCAHARDDQFPTGGARAPYLASLEEVRRVESPLLVDPYHDVPERHFDFLMDGRCSPVTPRGHATATLLELNSQRLRDQRRENLNRLGAELFSWAREGDGERLRETFDIGHPFAGARLNVLKRVLAILPYGRKLISGSAQHLPGRMAAYIVARDEERNRLPELLDQLLKTDEARELEPDQLRQFGATRPLASQDPRAHSSSTKPRHLGRIVITHLKGITHLDIGAAPKAPTRRGAPCLMLLGENSTGKSTILQGIALALLGGPQARRLKLRSDDYLRSESSDRWDQLAPQSAQVEVEFLFGEGRAGFTLDALQRRIIGSDQPSALVLGYGPRRYFNRRRSAAPLIPYARVRTLFDPLATIPYPGVWLNGLPDHQFHAVARALRPILALSDRDELVRDIDGRISVVVEDRPVPIERLSEGYRSVFALAADVFRQMLAHFPHLEFAHGIVLIDELETHLHPRWKMQVMSALRRALPNVQFVVTTHDPLCLRGMQDGEVVVLQRDGGGAITVLQDLPSLKGMRAEQLLTSDYFGLSSTIDPETELAVARFAEDVAERPDERVTSEAVSRLMLGDSAGEQVIQEALRRFLNAREKPAGSLRSDIRAEAVEAVYEALAGPLPLNLGGTPEGGPA
jgi:uncharacterized protein (TIGR02646 family)